VIPAGLHTVGESHSALYRIGSQKMPRLRLFVVDGRLAIRFSRFVDRIALVRAAMADHRTTWRYDPGAPETDLRFNGVLIQREGGAR
jgi:hypothetical protein